MPVYQFRAERTMGDGLGNGNFNTVVSHTLWRFPTRKAAKKWAAKRGLGFCGCIAIVKLRKWYKNERINLP